MTSPPKAGSSTFRHQVELAWGALGTMLDVALIVVGTALLGLAFAVILDGFELVTIGLDLSTGAMLGSSLVIGILGGFALGVASEGPLGRGRRPVGFPESQVLMARVVAAVVVGLLLILVESLIQDFLTELPLPFHLAADVIRAAGIAGATVVPIIAVPLAWWARSGGFGRAMADDGDIPLMYFVWAVTTMVLL